MRDQLSAHIDNAITIALLVVAAATPLLFLSKTTEFYEMPKLIFLVVATIVLYGLWIASWIFKGKIAISRTPLDIPLLLLLVVVIASTYFSESRYPAIYGNFPRVHGSAISWVTYILLYFVTASHLTSLSKIKTFMYVLFGSGIVISVITLLSFFGVYLPFDFARGVNFTPTGSSFATIAFLLLLLPLPILSLINPNKYLSTPTAIALSILFGVTIVLIGSVPSYIALVVAFALCFFVSKPNQIRRTLPVFIVPVAVIGLVLTLAYVPLPGNKIQQLESNFPKEIQLPFSASWKVSVSAFRDAPFVGTGPASYLPNFTTYKPLEFNQLPFWNFSFDTAHNEYLQVLGTLGAFGFASFLLLSLIVVISSWKNLALDSSAEGDHDGPHVLLPALAISGILSIILLAIHPTTVVSATAMLFIFAALMMSQKSVRDRVLHLSLGIKASTAGNRQFDLFPIIVFVLFLVAAVPGLVKAYNVVAADYYHRLALSQADRNGALTYEYLQKAETMNPHIDLYRVDMAQTNFALANAIAARANQTGGQSALTDQDRQTIQTLLSQAITEGRVAVTLNPRSSRNWEVLASIYRNITGVADNALTFALDAYGRSIQRDPLNPALRANVGGIYYATQNYDLAIRFFSDAANLKPDYTAAYYNLALALRDKGDIQNAALVAQQAVNLLAENRESEDYKTASDLLENLKTQIASGQAAEQADASQGDQGESALQDPELPEVADLGNPPDVATPAAVRQNPQANIPRLSPAPSPARNQ